MSSSDKQLFQNTLFEGHHRAILIKLQKWAMWKCHVVGRKQMQHWLEEETTVRHAYLVDWERI